MSIGRVVVNPLSWACFVVTSRPPHPRTLNLSFLNLALLCLGVAFLQACAGAPTPGAEPTPSELTSLEILVQSDSRGEVYPCKCPGNPAGGLSRRSGLHKHLLAQYKNALVLEGGDFSSELANSEEALLVSRLMVEAMGLMPYHAVAIGSRELFLGDAYLEHLANSLPVVSANLMGEKSPIPEFLWVDDRVLVTSILDPLIYYEWEGALTAERSHILIEDPSVALGRLHDQTHSAQFTVVLAQMSLERILELAPSHPEVDVWVQAHEPEKSENPGRVGDRNALVLEPGPRSREIMGVFLTQGAEADWDVKTRFWDLKRSTHLDQRVESLLETFKLKHPDIDLEP